MQENRASPKHGTQTRISSPLPRWPVTYLVLLCKYGEGEYSASSGRALVPPLHAAATARSACLVQVTESQPDIGAFREPLGQDTNCISHTSSLSRPHCKGYRLITCNPTHALSISYTMVRMVFPFYELYCECLGGHRSEICGGLQDRRAALALNDGTDPHTIFSMGSVYPRLLLPHTNDFIG